MMRLPTGLLFGPFSSVLLSVARYASGSFTSRLSSPRLANGSSKSWRLLKATIKYGCIMYVVNNYIVDFFVCIGPSMEPTIQSHDVVITEHISQRFGSLRRGDLIVARSPINPTSFICKRIVGLNGDLVYDENLHLVKVPRGHVWLEGDNARDSVDSRRYGKTLADSRNCYHYRLTPAL
ncbi:hypothetical protein RvY_14257-2 [Ramazzottius varieornatus]|uniref:Mitochondrial inner membrane protease subunit n=1 Tax=Ramazzottius varieornatus TaxID=947166 RepID=A0A1D1VZ55_RAMVA|nr:hypothetical protein RvY_14257-2 [Ramazzottius varieornatus]